jgi:hypothetical protein
MKNHLENKQYLNCTALRIKMLATDKKFIELLLQEYDIHNFKIIFYRLLNN